MRGKELHTNGAIISDGAGEAGRSLSSVVIDDRIHDIRQPQAQDDQARYPALELATRRRFAGFEHFENSKHYLETSRAVFLRQIEKQSHELAILLPLLILLLAILVRTNQLTDIL